MGIDSSAVVCVETSARHAAPVTSAFGGVAEYLLAVGDDDAVAFAGGGSRVTYGQLRQDVAALAASLAAIGLSRGAPVALMAANGAFWAAAYLAIMQRGLVVVPLPVVLRADEVAARTAFVGANAVIVDRRHHRLLASSGLAVITESALDASTPWSHRDDVDIDEGSDAAYLFTSGTTGSPRVVRLTHANIRANTESILGYLDIRASDRALVVLPYSYVFGASLLHTHLRVGAALVDHASAAFPETIVTELERQRCTVFAGVPSIFHALLRNSSFSSRPLPQLRIVQQAGGRLPLPLLHEFAEAQPQARIHVMYGQTEATARLSALDPELLLTKPGSIGQGIPGVSLRVVDESGRPVAPGEVGEIRARGANISPGYLGDDGATASKMSDGELRTGDLATVDDEGYIYVVDRAEDFIKSWGYRISSQDVEAAAIGLTDLVAVAAVGVPDASAGERIELVAVRRPGSTLTEDEVLAQCRGVLPRHSVPAAVHFVERLPVNANGKVLKREVRRLLEARVETEPGRDRES